MILTVLQISCRRLLHNRVELLLTFLVPIAFFSIFAIIFGGGLGRGTTPRIKVVAVDEIQSAVSSQVMAALAEQESLRFVRESGAEGLKRDEAMELVRSGSATMAIILREDREQLAAELMADASDQVAAQVVSAVVNRSIMLSEAEYQVSQLTAGEQEENETQLAVGAAGDSDDELFGIEESLQRKVEIIDVMGEGKANPVVSMYASGIAVMFLLFGATGGGGALLEERENQTLDRLLSTQMSMDQLLLGKWFYMSSIGVLQVGVMFVWAQLVFNVDLIGHLDGFLMMTVVTALAASAFGLFLATLCKSRGQLNGLSVILILTMSALGGSMVPRYLMSDELQQYGLWTFNAWALDGYTKVFWRELPVDALAPQLGVLLMSGVVFLLAARVLAVRWETD
ncbi:ABC transporter permease [Rubripirellula sp.]|jgi:ABC-2 type transport system permease protein|nr:ABC transporter permease [Rubripirellula sp.]MDB4634177.1 ABC transporter permease [Rubripirellula sp.]MDC0288146.1 ABC transporter permease [Rubripirellula sp.]MDC0317271.1 ABC transporter permease [bacterium]